ncbi:MAG: hypothetical protein MJ150_02295 [Clostridia bacterium]|nr:hypothetical protein [Clostridia bacterium]
MSKTYITLLEQAIMTLFLSLACAISLQVFANTSNLAAEAREKQYAIVELANVAETLKSCDGNYNDAAKISSGVLSDNTIIFYYDFNWVKTDKDNAEYIVKVSAAKKSKGLGLSEIQAMDQSGNIIDSLEVCWQEAL